MNEVPDVPILERVLRPCQFFTIKEDYPSAITAGLPVGTCTFQGTVFSVYSCTVKGMAELRDHFGKSPIGEWNVLSEDAKPEDTAYAAREAMGGGDCPLTVPEMLNQTWSFEGVMKEALMVFFWGGPLLGSSDETPKPNPKQKKGGSSTAGSGG